MELGSEFNLSLSNLTIKKHSVFSYLSQMKESFFFDCGRGAIKYLSEFLNDNDEVLLPEFICESVINCFGKSRVKFYRLSNEFGPDIIDIKNKITSRSKVLFLMHYFGSIQPKKLLDELNVVADESDLVIIEDTTHSVFSKRVTIGDYIVSSIRKWCPVPGCGVLSIVNNKLKIREPNLLKTSNNSRAEGMILKDLFLREVLDCNSEYRKVFYETEHELDTRTKMLGMSDFSEFLLKCIDVESMILKRKKNFALLKSKLSFLGMKPVVGVNEYECPLAFVIRVNNRDDFRRDLINKKIYCAVHWPFDGYRKEERPFAEYNANSLISLPIDQRYDENHMGYLAEIISKYRGDLLL